MKNNKMMKKLKGNSLNKALWGVFLIGVVVILSIIPVISAWEFDNVKNYDKENKEYEITNIFGLGSNIAKIKLNSEQNQMVARGYGKVAEFTIDNGKFDYEEVINGIELYNIKNGMKEIIRDVDYKYKTLVDVPAYKTICDLKTSANGTYEDCYEIEEGTKKEEQWLSFDNSLIEEEVITIGIFTEVKKGDYVEWIINIYGDERLTEWAEWTESLNVDLVSYYKLDETSGAVVDSLDKNNGVVMGDPTRGVTGVVGNAFYFDGTNDAVNISDSASLSALNPLSISFWFKSDTAVANRYIITKSGQSGAGEFEWYFLMVNTTHMMFAVFDYSADAGIRRSYSSSNLYNGSWHHIVGVWNGSATDSSIQIWDNGVQVDDTNSGWGSGFVDIEDTNRDVMFMTGAGSSYLNGTLDEVGIWNRVLTESEILELGEGITYIKGLNITLNSPVDYYNSTINLIDFNCSATDNVGVLNLTLIINNVDNHTITNSTPNENLTLTTSLNMNDGVYNWTCRASDGTGIFDPLVATGRNLSVNTTPAISFISSTYADGTNLTGNSIPVNVTLTETYFKNVTFSFYLNDVLNETKTFTDSTRFYSKTGCTSGTWKVNATVWTTTGQFNSTETRTYLIDILLPTITITNPAGNIRSHIIGNNLTFNWTVSDTNLNSCWYNYAGVNTSVTCSDNSTEINITDSIDRTFTFYANDTFGNTGSSTRTWNYYVFINAQTFNTNVYETSTESLSANVTYNSTLFTSLSSNLIYNGTSYLATKSTSGINTILTRSLDIPTTITTQNKSFLWEFLLSNSSGTDYVNTTSKTQTVNPLIFVKCNATYPSPVFVNFTTYNESNLALTNVFFDGTFKYYASTGGGTVTKSVSVEGITANSTYQFCTNYNSSFIVDSSIRLRANGSIDRNYFFNDITYNNITTETHLFMQSSGSYEPYTTNSLTNVIIEVQDTGLNPLEDYTVIVERYYPSTGSYKIVIQDITDIYGQIVTRLVENTVKYKFTFKNPSGTTVKTTGDMTIACRAVICVLPFVIEDTTDDFEQFTNTTNFDYSFSFDNNTNIFTFSWNDVTGDSITTRLFVERILFNGTTTVCDDTSISLSSVLSCNVGSQRASYIGRIYRQVTGEDERFLAVINARIGEIFSTFGKEGLFWVFILLFTMIGVGSFNPPIAIILYNVGFFMMGLLGIVSFNIPIFFATNIIMILFIWAFKS